MIERRRAALANGKRRAGLIPKSESKKENAMIEREPELIELGEVSTETKGGVEHMIEDRDPLV